MSQTVHDLRKEYAQGHLLESEVDPNPYVLFTDWFRAASNCTDIHEANAMTLATATPDGRPAARMVLLKSFDEQGFVFYTNYESRKGREVAANPRVALLFWWAPLERQVRIEGRIEKVPAAESDEYFYTRPLGSRLGALVSEQSRVIPNREILDRRYAELQAEYSDSYPDRPPFWGGYRIVPDAIEFWQGGANRLHDRLRYTRQADDSWLLERLSP